MNEQEIKTKFCKHCGAKIPEDAVLCTSCGRQVEEIKQNAAAQPNIIINNDNINTNTNTVLWPVWEEQKQVGCICTLLFSWDFRSPQIL